MTCPYRSTRKESTVNVLNNVPPIGTHIMYRRATETKSDHSTVEYIFDTYENNRDITSPLERTENEIKYYPSADHYIKGNRDYVNYLFRDVPTNYSRLGLLLPTGFSGRLHRCICESSDDHFLFLYLSHSRYNQAIQICHGRHLSLYKICHQYRVVGEVRF